MLEDDIVADMARLVWRKQNLGTLRLQSMPSKVGGNLGNRKVDTCSASATVRSLERRQRKIGRSDASCEQGRIRKELGDTFELVDIGDAATFDGLTSELDIEERLHALHREMRQTIAAREGV